MRSRVRLKQLKPYITPESTSEIANKNNPIDHLIKSEDHTKQITKILMKTLFLMQSQKTLMTFQKPNLKTIQALAVLVKTQNLN